MRAIPTSTVLRSSTPAHSASSRYGAALTNTLPGGTDEPGGKQVQAEQIEDLKKEIERITHEHVELIDKAFSRKEQELLEV